MSAVGQPSPWDEGNGRLWSLWDMLQSYVSLYEVAIALGKVQQRAVRYSSAPDEKLMPFEDLGSVFLEVANAVQEECAAAGFNYTASLVS